MEKIKILALFGKSGSGKDTIQKWMVSTLPYTKGVISCTTRPKRDYEIDGIDYHFLTPDMFAGKVLDGSMLEATSFNDWFYGTPIDELDKNRINIGVFNIRGIECLLEDPRLDVLPVRVEVSDVIRLKRQLNRENNPNCKEICRRFLTDEVDFELIPFPYILFDNSRKQAEFYNLQNIPRVYEFMTLDNKNESIS